MLHTRESIIDTIIENVRETVRETGRETGRTPDVRVQPDAYRGWLIAVIWDGFEQMSMDARRQLALADLDDIEIEWAEFLTPEEQQWAGALPGDLKPEELPFWAESLGKAREALGPDEILPELPSDLDEDVQLPIVATFYSLRGGVGRSTALAYTATLLADKGRRVVCVDMDLEAPGLRWLLASDARIPPDRGVVELLRALDHGDEPDFAEHLIPADRIENLFIVPAGEPSADYARKLRDIRPDAWYREDKNPLRMLLEGLRNKLPFTPDVILLDSRTGITELSGPLLFDLSDIAVIVFFPHPQAKTGTELLARSLVRAKTGRPGPGGQALAPELRFLVSPIPASSAPEVKQRYQSRPLEWITEWMRDLNEYRQRHHREEIIAPDITHFVAYQEIIATSDRISGERNAFASYEPIAAWIERFVPSPRETGSERSVLSGDKDVILEELSFSTGTAERQADFLKNFIRTKTVREALSEGFPLILGRKGTGKTALFRYLSESDRAESDRAESDRAESDRAESDSAESDRAGVAHQVVVVEAPPGLADDKPWFFSAEEFASIDRTMTETRSLSWRSFWFFYLSVALHHASRQWPNAPSPPSFIDKDKLGTALDLVRQFQRCAREQPDAGLEFKHWFRSFDAAATHSTLLLLDGLDTRFGSEEEERARRRKSIEGLFSAWMDTAAALRSIKFKILLREDIWRQLTFENKSHLYGQSKKLEWKDQAEFIKVVLKQAAGSSEQFKRLLRDNGILLVERIDDWAEEETYRAWYLLVGERMRGGRTTFTKNWIWSRLADGNWDHSPRFLLQLFHEAVPWEQKEQRKSPYERSIIRPRALIDCLDAVSNEAKSALVEEFPELQPLLDKLAGIGRTPVLAEELEELRDSVSLAREIGLLGVYEERDAEVRRYKVPDIYRYGVGMTRKGQA